MNEFCISISQMKRYFGSYQLQSGSAEHHLGKDVLCDRGEEDGGRGGHHSRLDGIGIGYGIGFGGAGSGQWSHWCPGCHFWGRCRGLRRTHRRRLFFQLSQRITDALVPQALAITVPP